MANVSVYNMEGREVGTIELNDAIFGVEINEHLVHMAVVQQLANNRQGTQKAKTRSEVSGGGRKPWRQKGTGRARAGTSRSPLWYHGGVIFAPKPRDYSQSMNKKMRRLAMKSVLSAKVQDKELFVIDALTFDEPKTKEMVKVLDNLKLAKTLVVTADSDRNVFKSVNNIATAKCTTVGELNVYDMLKYDNLLVTKDSVDKIEEVFA